MGRGACGVEGDAGLSSIRIAARLGLRLEVAPGSGRCGARELRRPGRGDRAGKPATGIIWRAGSGEGVLREGRAPTLTGPGAG